MITIDRLTGRKYQVLKSFAANGDHMEAKTGRRYFLIKRYI